ncbi:outer membrane lipoprotein carrier protein LolA [Acinetobacter sp. MD2(2019)]|uniref:LolA family protein n=1 Tax=Acinetobacter sp. MD2(2019) TaxID=2605273 RepID=UPI002D1EB10E|nr:outer membrane lipoprotein carrier protein LolA [Acinetobacter sp. MD2(2019)]MEB3753610.1 outer membrane lipoprotein carrier protein LolA [Acinetobacter sp. MD2(2019)]
MKLKLRIGSLVLLGIISTLQWCVAAPLNQASEIFKQVSATPIVHAQFEQEKKLTALNRTYVSKGNVLFSKQQGVLWQMHSPVQADLIVTPEKLVQKTQRTMSQIDVKQSPYGSVATLFLQLMAGDEKALASHFNVLNVQKNPQGWMVALSPKSSLFKKLFNQVNVQGGRFVNQIVIQEKDGNITQIHFSQQTTQPQTLTAQEYALFQLAK